METESTEFDFNFDLLLSLFRLVVFQTQQVMDTFQIDGGVVLIIQTFHCGVIPIRLSYFA